jgi:hypothetical protein
MESIEYEIVVDTEEPDRRLTLLHDNVRKYGTVFNTVAPGTNLTPDTPTSRSGTAQPKRPCLFKTQVAQSPEFAV